MLNIAHRCFITLIVIVYINSKHYNWKEILKKIMHNSSLKYKSLMAQSILCELPSKIQFISRQIAMSHIPNVLTNGPACFVTGKTSARMEPTSSPESYT